MSGLRDARLKRALESAPDAGMRAQPRTRRAILARAHEAVGPAPAQAWWTRVWHGAGRAGAPWTAAFATVVVATLVVVLWHDREVPGPRGEAPPAGHTAVGKRANPEQGPASSGSAPGVAPMAPAVPPAASAAPKARGAKVAPDAAARKAAPVPMPPPASVAPPQPAHQAPAAGLPAAPAAAEPPRERGAEQAPRGPQRDEVTGEGAKGQAARGFAERAREDVAAPGPRAAPNRLASQPVAAAAATDVRIEGPGRVALARLDHPSRLADLLARVIREARTDEPLEAPVAWRVELRAQGGRLGTLELAGAQARWSPAPGGGTALVGRPDAALLQALDEELARIAGR